MINCNKKPFRLIRGGNGLWFLSPFGGTNRIRFKGSPAWDSQP